MSGNYWDRKCVSSGRATSPDTLMFSLRPVIDDGFEKN